MAWLTVSVVRPCPEPYVSAERVYWWLCKTSGVHPARETEMAITTHRSAAGQLESLVGVWLHSGPFHAVP
jgi:hypothetical protein